MNKKCIIAVGLILLLITLPMRALASDEKATMEEINSSEEKIIDISDETIFYPESHNALEKSSNTGKYPIYTRLVTSKSSSNGIKEKSSKTGLLSSVGTTVLGFKITGIPGMAVSTIITTVGLVAKENNYVQAKTYISYLDNEKKGQARWSNESNYTTWIISGKRNYYKHVLGAKKLSNEKWTTKTKNYTSTPAKTLKGNCYDKSEKWFKEDAHKRHLSRSLLVDTPY